MREAFPGTRAVLLLRLPLRRAAKLDYNEQNNQAVLRLRIAPLGRRPRADFNEVRPLRNEYVLEIDFKHRNPEQGMGFRLRVLQRSEAALIHRLYSGDSTCNRGLL